MQDRENRRATTVRPAIRHIPSRTGAANPAAPPSVPPKSLGGRPVPPVPPMAPIAGASAGRGSSFVPIRSAGGMPMSRVSSVSPTSGAVRASLIPNLRRNVCPHFYLTGPRGAIPIQAPHLLKALLRQERNVSRCQLRGGVHLEGGYVGDVCMTPRFNQCVFYEDGLEEG